MENDSGRLEERRRMYAHRITSIAGIDAESGIGRDIRAAFEAIPREKFVGAPPWRIVSPEDQFQGVSDDPTDIYQDVLVTLDINKGLNNGQPSLHAACLKALAPKKGEHVVHVGAGTGYYTAILALLVSEAGQVDAYEIEPELARHAAASLAGLHQVKIHCRSGAEAPLPTCDVLYVNAACAEPLGVWLDALRCGGRLLFPLEAGGEAGQMLLVTRLSERDYAARFLTGVQFVSCVGAQDPDAVRALELAFRRGKWQAVRSLRRNDAPDESCWCAGRGWWLSTRPTNLI
jgi:protein-L-isoaspartate(D-aspartate) O-methyltransferase